MKRVAGVLPYLLPLSRMEEVVEEVEEGGSRKEADKKWRRRKGTEEE